MYIDKCIPFHLSTTYDNTLKFDTVMCVCDIREPHFISCCTLMPHFVPLDISNFIIDKVTILGVAFSNIKHYN